MLADPAVHARAAGTLDEISGEVVSILPSELRPTFAATSSAFERDAAIAKTAAAMSNTPQNILKNSAATAELVRSS